MGFRVIGCFISLTAEPLIQVNNARPWASALLTAPPKKDGPVRFCEHFVREILCLDLLRRYFFRHTVGEPVVQ